MSSLIVLAPLGGEACPYFAPFLGFAGAASAMIFSSLGAAYGTAKSGIGIAGVGQVKPEMYPSLTKNDEIAYPSRDGWNHRGVRAGYLGLDRQ